MEHVNFLKIIILKWLSGVQFLQKNKKVVFNSTVGFDLKTMSKEIGIACSHKTITVLQSTITRSFNQDQTIQILNLNFRFKNN